MEADFARFYNLPARAVAHMSWRRFQNLLAGLRLYEDSAWRRILETPQDANTGTQWEPPVRPEEIAPDLESGQNLLERMFLNTPGG